MNGTILFPLTDLSNPTSTLTKYGNTALSVIQLLILIGLMLIKPNEKFKKRLVNNESRVKTLEYKLSKLRKTNDNGRSEDSV